MITDIPTADEFKKSAANYLYLAWEIVLELIFDFNQAYGYATGMVESEPYWAKSQVPLGNAIGLIQQSMELALKGRIAGVSPYLLISRDPKNWPSGVETSAVPFSQFHTLDAADLVKVHNTFINPALPPSFQTFFNEIRVERNKLMHSVPKATYSGERLVKNILTVASVLFGDESWSKQCLRLEAEGRHVELGSIDRVRNSVMGQFAIAVDNLKPADAEKLLGFKSKQRSYLCPACFQKIDRDYWDYDSPRLAQLTEKTPACTTICCFLCEEISEVSRINCNKPECEGNVFSEGGTCLTCQQHWGW